MKKAIIIYDSKFGNTKKIAKAISKGLKNKGITSNCYDITTVNIENLCDCDFIAIGGPTHRLGMSESMKEFLTKLKSVNIKGKKGFCFDTRKESRWNTFDLNGANKRIEKFMKKKKVTMIKPRMHAIVKGREGPLVKEAEKKFEDAGKKIAELLSSSTLEESKTKKIWSSIFLGIGTIIFTWGVVTLLPTEIAPWHGKLTTKQNFLGRYAHCPWSPINSLILFIISACFFYPTKRLFKDIKANVWYILLGIGTAIVG